MTRAPGPDGALGRILAVNPSGLRSGAEAALLRILRAARRQGWDVRVAAPDGPLADQLARDALSRIPFPELRFSPLPKPLALTAAAARSLGAARVLRRTQSDADVILVNGWHALPALRLARVRPPVVWFVHDVIGRRDQRSVVRASAPVVTLAIAPSRAVAQPLIAAGLNVEVVRNGTPWPVDPAPSASLRPPVIGLSGPLTAWKGQDVLLEAVACLPRRDVEVELMGGSFPRDAGYVRRLEERARQADLAGRVRFLGHVDDALARLRRWTMAVSASVDPEAAPLNVLEAMSVGVPMVATDHGGTPEVLGDAGLLVPPGDSSALAAAISRMLDDSELRRRCATAGPHLIAAGLTLEEQERAFLRVLGQVAGRARVA